MKNTLQLTALVIFLTIIGIQPTRSQTQFTGWLGTFQNYKLSPKFGLYFDGQFRSTDRWRQMNALLLRPGVNFYFTPSITGTAGYAFIPQQRLSGGVMGYLPEHRTWQQLTYTHAARLGHHARTTTISHRLRLEQRYIPKHHAEGNSLVHDRHVYTGRLRYFARAVIPMGGMHAITAPAAGPAGSPAAASGTASSQAFTQGFFAAVQNEIFLNIGDPSPVNGKIFDQNRAYLALGYRCSKQFDVEMGYLNQYIRGAGSNSTNNHVVQLATYIRL
ncbi:MAG TPA: DUF2490 domain-containing protein [Puia sp.]|jgi:hypothetical protein